MEYRNKAGTGEDAAFLTNGMILSGPEADPIPPTESRVVLFDLPGVSLFNSHYLMPIGRFPVDLTLELVSDRSSCARPRPLTRAVPKFQSGRS